MNYSLMITVVHEPFTGSSLKGTVQYTVMFLSYMEHNKNAKARFKQMNWQLYAV